MGQHSVCHTVNVSMQQRETDSQLFEMWPQLELRCCWGALRLPLGTDSAGHSEFPGLLHPGMFAGCQRHTASSIAHELAQPLHATMYISTEQQLAI